MGKLVFQGSRLPGFSQTPQDAQQVPSKKPQAWDGQWHVESKGRSEMGKLPGLSGKGEFHLPTGVDTEIAPWSWRDAAIGPSPQRSSTEAPQTTPCSQCETTTGNNFPLTHENRAGEKTEFC